MVEMQILLAVIVLHDLLISSILNYKLDIQCLLDLPLRVVVSLSYGLH